MQDNNMSSIETQLSSLEKITEELESGKLPIDEAINLYTKGMELALSCKKNLDNLGQRIQLAKKNAHEAIELEKVEFKDEE